MTCATAYLDYVRFLCSGRMATAKDVFAATKTACPAVLGNPTDLNMPYITMANLRGTWRVPRTVTNVTPKPETYTITWTNPADCVITATPSTFTIGIGRHNKQSIMFTIRATGVSQAYSHAQIMFKGSLGHTLHIPVSVGTKALR